MTRTILHRPALEALVRVAISPRRWTSQSELAADCGFTPSTLSSARSGQRGLSDEALAALCREFAAATGADAEVFHAALNVPWVARPADVRSKELLAGLHRTQDVLTGLTRAVMTNGD